MENRLLQAVTCRKLPSGMASRFGRNRWTVALYGAVPRKKDGKYTWRFDKDVGLSSMGGYSAPVKIEEAAIEYASKNSIPYIRALKHGTACEISDVELLALSRPCEQ